VLLWARLVVKAGAVDQLLVGDPHRIGRRDIEVPVSLEVPVAGRRIVDGGDARKEDVCLPSEKGLALVAVMLV
jgi:hypothetical protein